MAFVLSLLMALVLVSYGPGGSLGCDLSQNHVLVGRQNLKLLGQMRRLSPRFCLQDRKDFAFPQEMVKGGQLHEAQARGAEEDRKMQLRLLNEIINFNDCF